VSDAASTAASTAASEPAGGAPDRRWLPFGRQRLAGRIVWLSLALLLLVQAAGFAVVRRSIERNVHGQLASELRIGERVWRRLLDTHAQRLRQASTLLAADYGFRSAIASRDLATIGSVLQNHGARIGASVVTLLDTGFVPRATRATPGVALPPAPALLNDVAAALARDSTGSPLALVDARVMQFVVVPVRAPVVVGWVMVGFPVDQALADDMRALSGLEVALLTAPLDGSPRVVAGTLPAERADTWSALATLADDDSEIDIVVDGQILLARRLALPAVGGAVHTLLARSVDEVAAPFRQLQLVLAAITAAGVALFALGSLWTARRVTAPLRTLVAASEELGRGDYGRPLDGTARRDEIGELARAFDQMRANLGTHAAQLHQLAYTDRLTGMPNRAHFTEATRLAIVDRLGSARTLAVLMLDIDRFRHVNDVLGYSIGDRLLRTVAERLTFDVVRDGDLVARLGGDEFALLLPDADADVARGVAARIAASFERPLVLDDQTVDLGAGIGIACWPVDANDAETLLARAEVAMVGAKGGSDPVRVYDPALDSGSAQTLSMLSELRRAVDGGELRLFLQPKVALADRRLVGAEALVRWQHPHRGLLPPADFVPFAEQTGFVRRLTLWVFEEAARQWATLAEGAPSLRLSVNLSTRDLMDAELPAKFDALLRRAGAPASAFCLEITESAIMDDPARALATLEQLSAAGFKLSIDDFGTGYSSLAYLRRLPVDELKIDRSFVRGMCGNADDAKIVRSTIDLAHNLGLTVVAEGIEDAALVAALARLGCDEGQGYHLGRPQPLPAFRAWLRRGSAGSAAVDAAVGAGATPTGRERALSG
jgi:diguanylate cyclase (GGDEF)-like protein